jgi:hypothetical protein
MSRERKGRRRPSAGAQAVGRTNQNGVPQASHRCSTLIRPLRAVTWLTGSIRWLRHEGHRRSRVSGSTGSGSGYDMARLYTTRASGRHDAAALSLQGTPLPHRPGARVDSAPCRGTLATNRPRRRTRSSSGSSPSCATAAPWCPSSRRRPPTRSRSALRPSACSTTPLVGALEAGLVRTAEDALTVLRQASQPLGPMGAEWLQRQERDL